MALRLISTSVFRQSRNISRSVRRSAPISTACVRQQSTTASPLPNTIPGDQGHATGQEQKELDAILAGNPDPFNLNVTKGVAGTKDNPTVVPSMYGERIVGCVCEEDSTSITWMVLKKDKMQRCAKCGNCFVLVTGKTNALAD